MRIILATCGSRGDVQPMIALCLALKAAGHDVLLLGPPEKRLWAEKLGCPYMALGQDATAFIAGLKNSVRLGPALSFISYVRQEIEHQFKVLPQILKAADLVIGSSLVFGMSSVAERLKIPYRYLVFSPQLFPSRAHPFPVIRHQVLPGWCNRLSWLTARTVDRFNLRHLINRHRKKMGVRPVHDAWDHIIGTRPILACDRQVARPPGDTGKEIVQTGYLHLDPQQGLSPGIERFLKNNPRPVYAGFGSMPPQEQEKTTPMLVAAARSLGRALIIARPWQKADLGIENKVLFVKNCPHLLLFPRTCAVIHHGGAGTTAAAIASGVPQVIVPHILDQYYHGHRIHMSGLGPKPIWRSRLTAGRLAAALEICLFNQRMRGLARKARASIDPEASLLRAVKTIEAPLSVINQ